MFEQLKVLKHKALEGCILTDLNRINVICGKNNSGKSTLLEGINQKQTCIAGQRFDESKLKKFYDDTISKMSWQESRHSGRHQLYFKILRNIMSSQEIWYENEDKHLAQQIINTCWNSVPLNGFPIPETNITSVYGSIIGNNVNTILLPPKRILELSGPVQTSQQITSTGTGILDYLFYAKNQQHTSNDRQIYEKISEAFADISCGYKFDVFIGKNNDLNLSIAYKDRSWIDASDCGLGLQDLIVILYFAVHPSNDVVLIEEPESHLHPDMQRRLLCFLKDGTPKQYFISTHSNVFLNNALVDRVFFTSFQKSIDVDDATKYASILDDLGYSVADNLVSDLVILVEGPTDTPVVEEFLIKMGVFKDYNIKIWPLGGDNMLKLDLSVFAEKYRILALVDNDPGSNHVRKKFAKNCKENGIRVSRLKRYSIENYFSLNALQAVFGTTIPADLIEIEPDKKLEDQIGISVKGNNRKLAQLTDIKDIEGTDLYKFLVQVKEICEKGNL